MIPPRLARLYEDIFLNRRKPKHPQSLNGALDCFMAYNSYGGYCIPRSEIKSGPAQAIMAGSVWEPELLKFITENAEGDVVHAGAFFGDGLPIISQAIKPYTLWAFEPSDLYYYADLTRLISRLVRTNLYHKALGEKPDDETTTIDETVPGNRKVSIIHLDIEGDEQKALNGAKKTIARCKPILIVEEVFNTVVIPEGYRKVDRLYSQEFGRNTILVPCT